MAEPGSLKNEAAIAEARWLAGTVGRARAFPLSRRDINVLARSIRVATYDAGTTLFAQDERPPAVWVVAEGLIELTHQSGKQAHCIRLLQTGETVGDIEILQHRRAGYTARTITRSRCLLIESQRFMDALVGSATLAARWTSKLATQVSRNHERLIEVLPATLPQRLARLLLDQMNGGVLEVPQEVLASLLGVHRSPLNQALKSFEEAGLISIGYRKVEVIDVDALTDIAHAG